MRDNYVILISECNCIARQEINMRGAIKYKRKEIVLISIVVGLYIIAFLYIASEYLSDPSATASLY